MRPTRLGILVALALPACLYDAGDRCGDHQVLNALDACVCDGETVLVDGRCRPCPEGEAVAGGACGCPDGKVRDTATGGCVAPPSGQGVACGAASPCPTAADPLCAPEGYCTRACAGQGDCDGGYACDLAAPAPRCVRPPSGLLAPCDSQAACGGFEAGFCEETLRGVCLVAGCRPGAGGCFVGWTCCDVGRFGLPVATLCVPEGQCPG